MRSEAPPLQRCSTVTVCPSARSIAAQRDAVLRFPLRERGGAGVTSEILNLFRGGLNCRATITNRSSMISGEPHAGSLTQMLTDARSRTLALVGDLSGAQLFGPRLAIVNPPLWEIGHLGWFQERWCLRLLPDGSLSPSMLDGADALYDSSNVAHDVRWNLPLPSLEATLRYLEAVLRRVCDRVEGGGMKYFAQLAAFHEEMHSEAFTYTRQTLAYP